MYAMNEQDMEYQLEYILEKWFVKIPQMTDEINKPVIEADKIMNQIHSWISWGKSWIFWEYLVDRIREGKDIINECWVNWKVDQREVAKRASHTWKRPNTISPGSCGAWKMGSGQIFSYRKQDFSFRVIQCTQGI